MMRLSLVSSLLSLLLVNSSVAVSEKKFLDQVILDSVLTEDEIFWGRNLQGESMSVPAEICEVTVEIGCSVGEGIDCNAFVPGDDCVETAVWTFEICNIGDIDLDVESATLQVNDDTIALNVTGGSISPDECVTLNQELDIDFCAGDTITTKITVEATPGPCEAMDEYVLTPQPPIPTPPPDTSSPTAPPPISPPPTTPPATPPPTTPPATPPPTTPPATPPPTTTPATPPPTTSIPSTPPPTTTPATPPPTTPEVCDVGVAIECVTDEGVGCDVFVATEEEDCIQTLNWSFTITNQGNEDLEVTSVVLEINGAGTDLDLPETPVVSPGNSVVVEVSNEIDYCEAGDIAVRVVVNADPGNCEGEDNYLIPRPENRCEVEIESGCTSGEGINCDVYVPTGDDCNSTAVFTYSITNVGDEDMEIQSVTVVRTDISGTQTTTLPVSETVLPAGGSIGVDEEVGVQWCIAQTITTTATVIGAPGPCDAETSYVIVTGTATRRVSDTSSSKSLRGF